MLSQKGIDFSQHIAQEQLIIRKLPQINSLALVQKWSRDVSLCLHCQASLFILDNLLVECTPSGPLLSWKLEVLSFSLLLLTQTAIMGNNWNSEWSPCRSNFWHWLVLYHYLIIYDVVWKCILNITDYLVSLPDTVIVFL